MVTVDGVIKDLFKETLSAVQERQDKQDERCSTLESQLKAIEEQLQAKTSEAQQLREGLEKAKQEVQGVEGRTKSLEDLDVPTLKARVERLHSDAEGIGGLVQVVQKTDDMSKEVQAMTAKVEENGRMCHACKTRTDEFADMIHAFDRRREDLDKFARETQQKLDVVEAQSSSVFAKQETLETSVATKYERLWHEVLAEIDKIDTSKATPNAVSSPNTGELATHTKSLVTYALNFVATGFQQRKMQEWSKVLVTAWREQTWRATRRHIGLRQLHNMVSRHKRRALVRWQQHVALGHVHDQIVQECNKKVSSVQVHSHELAKKLEEHVVSCRARLEEKESITQVDQKLFSWSSHLDGKLKAVQEQATSHGKRLEDVSGHLQSLADKDTTHDKKIEVVQTQSDDIRSELQDFAHSTEVQGMLRDLMLVWNLVKQLDVAKGDKKEVDALAVESANSLSRFERKVENIQESFSARLLEEGNCMREKCSQLDGKVDENAKQIQQWEKMWEKMDTVMDDVMRKVTMLQHQHWAETSRMPSSTLRNALNRDRSRAKKEEPPPVMMMMPPSHGNSMELHDHSRDSAYTRPFHLQAASPIFHAASLVQGCLDHQDATITMRPRAQLMPGRPRSAFTSRR